MQNHVYSQYLNLPSTSTSSVIFQDYPHPPGHEMGAERPIKKYDIMFQ